MVRARCSGTPASTGAWRRCRLPTAPIAYPDFSSHSANRPAGTTQTISGVISDGATPGFLGMLGPGTLVLSGANAYSGGTTISAGTLQLSFLPGLARRGALRAQIEAVRVAESTRGSGLGAT